MSDQNAAGTMAAGGGGGDEEASGGSGGRRRRSSRASKGGWTARTREGLWAAQLQLVPEEDGDRCVCVSWHVVAWRGGSSADDSDRLVDHFLDSRSLDRSRWRSAIPREQACCFCEQEGDLIVKCCAPGAYVDVCFAAVRSKWSPVLNAPVLLPLVSVGCTQEFHPSCALGHKAALADEALLAGGLWDAGVSRFGSDCLGSERKSRPDPPFGLAFSFPIPFPTPPGRGGRRQRRRRRRLLLPLPLQPARAALPLLRLPPALRGGGGHDRVRALQGPSVMTFGRRMQMHPVGPITRTSTTGCLSKTNKQEWLHYRCADVDAELFADPDREFVCHL